MFDETVAGPHQDICNLANQVRARYGIDTAVLDKGSRIMAHLVEAAVDTRRDHKQYSLRATELAKFIEWDLSRRGLNVMCVQRKDDLVVLTDAEMAIASNGTFKVGMRKMVRGHRKGQQVDRANLSKTEVAEHDRNLTVNGATLAGARRARRSVIVKPKPRPRQTPGK